VDEDLQDYLTTECLKLLKQGSFFFLAAMYSAVQVSDTTMPIKVVNARSPN
jgi:hypothetical protein